MLDSSDRTTVTAKSAFVMQHEIHVGRESVRTQLEGLSVIFC